jgi:Na+-driven multidrug efflux pump
MPSLFHSLAIISFVIAINLSSHDAFRTSSSSNFRAKAPGVLRHVSSPNFESVKTMHSKFMETLDSRLYWGLNRTDTELCKSLDKEFAEVALPAFFSLAADPFASLVDAMYVGRLSAAEQAGMGIAISAQYSIAKLYNDPLIKTSTSLVAGKSDKELSASVSTAILTAIVIGVLQTALFLLFSDPILTIMVKIESNI